MQAITAGVLAGCSDAIAQKISGVKRIQFRRLLLLMVRCFLSHVCYEVLIILFFLVSEILLDDLLQLYGLCYGGPFGHFFHKLMDAIFKGSKKDNTTVAKKVNVASSSMLSLFH